MTSCLERLRSVCPVTRPPRPVTPAPARSCQPAGRIMKESQMTVSGYATDVLVDAEWAQQHLNDPNVRLVEVDVDTTSYEQSHIPGAVAWNWTSQLADG